MEAPSGGGASSKMEFFWNAYTTECNNYAWENMFFPGNEKDFIMTVISKPLFLTNKAYLQI